jgi:hypothetical protein
VSIPDFVVARVLERAGWQCEHCGLSRPGGWFHLHHRLLRKHGGQHSVANILVVTPTHHNVAAGSIHQEVARSLRLGQLLNAGEDPVLVPVQLVTADLWPINEQHQFHPDETGESCWICCLPEANARHHLDLVGRWF